jgi:N-acetylmuramoyl-L-alanine amidase
MLPAALRLLVFGAVLGFAAGMARAGDAPLRAAPSRPAAPQLWPVTRLHGTDYVDVNDVARRFQLKAAWTKPQQELTLSDARGARVVFAASQYDFYFDKLRIFLGTRALAEKKTLFLSKLDVIKIVAPLLRPADHADLTPVRRPRTIVLDPGHGGGDPGKENLALGLNEKTFTLDVALRLQKLLEADGWRVLLTRKDDRVFSGDKKLDLQLRDEFANREKADLFLSIHFNAVERNPQQVTGVETYILPAQYMLSTLEEKKDDMTDVAYPGNRFDYANLLLGTELHRAVLGSLQTPDRGFKRGRLAVLRLLDCPGALVECAFLSNDAEARRIATPDFRQQIAAGLSDGLHHYASALEALHPAPSP